MQTHFGIHNTKAYYKCKVRLAVDYFMFSAGTNSLSDQVIVVCFISYLGRGGETQSTRLKTQPTRLKLAYINVVKELAIGNF